MDAAELTGDASSPWSGGFEERFAAFRPRLTALCTRIVGPTEAADVVQEAYIRASERIGELRDPDQFETWVLRIALNRAKSVLRTERQARDKAPLLDPVGGRGSDLGLRELIEGLPPRQRAVLVLHYGHGYRWAEANRVATSGEFLVAVFASEARPNTITVDARFSDGNVVNSLGLPLTGSTTCVP